jgi:hypothetical protein
MFGIEFRSTIAAVVLWQRGTAVHGSRLQFTVSLLKLMPGRWKHKFIGALVTLS